MEISDTVIPYVELCVQGGLTLGCALLAWTIGRAIVRKLA